MIAGADVVVEGGEQLRVVELPKDGCCMRLRHPSTRPNQIRLRNQPPGHDDRGRKPPAPFLDVMGPAVELNAFLISSDASMRLRALVEWSRGRPRSCRAKILAIVGGVLAGVPGGIRSSIHGAPHRRCGQGHGPQPRISLWTSMALVAGG